jgi:hypothetical protein
MTEGDIMRAGEVTYFVVDNNRSIRQNSEWDYDEEATETAFKFFQNEPDEVLGALGISLVTDSYTEAMLNSSVEEANTIAKTRGLPYRFMIELWISEDQAASEFLHAIDVSYYDVIEDVLRTNHGMADADENAIWKVTEDPDFDGEFDIEFHDKVREYIADYRVDEHEVNEMSGTWRYYLIAIDNDLSKVQKETKDLIMSITESVLAKIKKEEGYKKR